MYFGVPSSSMFLLKKVLLSSRSVLPIPPTSSCYQHFQQLHENRAQISHYYILLGCSRRECSHEPVCGLSLHILFLKYSQMRWGFPISPFGLLKPCTIYVPSSFLWLVPKPVLYNTARFVPAIHPTPCNPIACIRGLTVLHVV